MATERQELYCHKCDNYVQFRIDLSLNGNHVLKCPKCGHEHCRVVKNGKITDIRWDSRNPTFQCTAVTYTNTSLYSASASNSDYLRQSWFNSTTAC